MVVKPQAQAPQMPQAPVPVTPFGGMRETAPRGVGASAMAAMAVAIGIVSLGVVAVIVMWSSPTAPMGPMPSPVSPMAPVEAPTAVSFTGDGLIAMFDTQCAQGDAQSCITAGALYEHGQVGVPVDRAKARSYYQRACQLGNDAGCTLAKQL